MFTYNLTSEYPVDLECVVDAVRSMITLMQIHKTKSKDEVSTNYDYNTHDPSDLAHALVAKFDGLKDVHDIDWMCVSDNELSITIDSDDRQQADLVVRYLARCMIMSMDNPVNTVTIRSNDDIVMTAMHNVWYNGTVRPAVSSQLFLYTTV